MMMFAMEAKMRLENAGYRITLADGVPGLFDVEGLGRDLTLGQIRDLAARHGGPLTLPRLNVGDQC